jgi:hypothetical protein
MRVNRRVAGALIIALIIGLIIGSISIARPALGGESQAAPETDPPSQALLEFLGEWETGDGEWIDPTILEDWPVAEKAQEEEEDETH